MSIYPFKPGSIKHKGPKRNKTQTCQCLKALELKWISVGICYIYIYIVNDSN
jgi:hypothetical protein